VVAVVAAQELLFGLSRMWEMLADETGWESMICRDRGDAEAWIKKRVKEKFGIKAVKFG
jgi:hypothetical protein